ncbi:MAG: P1 family peptidase [SAR202 cluster bacterium]|nr:P1 family peptidase [SAR202 cluster bacterium]
MTRARLRDLGITVGHLPTGRYNAITDVPGISVGYKTLVAERPHVVRSGVTVILPRDDARWEDYAFAGIFSFNGYGEMTGSHWIEEAGLLTTPIAITNTHSVGIVRDAILRYAVESGYAAPFYLPVVAETDDSWLNAAHTFPVKPEHTVEALKSAKSGPIAEGNVGGGTGMICHHFKGGMGTSSRVVETRSGAFTVGALVQTNYGVRQLLRVDGVPVGREIGADRVPLARVFPNEGSGSIIVIVATDAPLLPDQCKRLARRATVGLARVGGTGHDGSGDIFLAFATGNHVPAHPDGAVDLRMLPHDQMDPLFDGTAEAVEEAIVNALTAAGDTTGQEGRMAHALPLDELKAVMKKHGRSR